MSRFILAGIFGFMAIGLGCASSEKSSTSEKAVDHKAMAMATPDKATTFEPQWAMKADIIEACSCPMFCQCYFNAEPAAHGEHAAHGGGTHFCKFNNAYKISKGNWGATALDGAKFWLSGDLGGDIRM